MTEPVRTGSRDDLCIEASRCLRNRFNGSQCSRCSAVCPSGAVSLEDGLAIDDSRCSGCLLCTTVCPSGALEFSSDFSACVAQLSKVEDAVLGCCRTREQANAWIPCLGGLSDEHLLFLSRRLTGLITFNLSRCDDCPNRDMVPLLRERLRLLYQPSSGAGSCVIVIAERPEQVRYREETVDRRSFFKSFRTSLFRTAAEVMSAGAGKAERRSDYTSKRIPARRELVHRLLEHLDQQQRSVLQARFFGTITISADCTGCMACVQACPTGALLKTAQTGDTPTPPQFTPDHCTGCGLCVEFCLDQAVTLTTG